MEDLTSSKSIGCVMELANNVITVNPTEGFLNLVKTKFAENKMYVYIGIAVIVLGIVLYYFYIKNKKETKGKTDYKPVLELPQPKAQTQAQPEPNAPENYNSVQEISADGYWVMDAQGRPVKVSGAFPQVGLPNQIAPLPIPKQAPSAAEIKMLQQQMLEQQLLEQQMIQQQLMQQQLDQQRLELQQIEQHKRKLAEQKAAQAKAQAKKPQPKLSHPEDSENAESDDIDVELARIKANEDDNVAQHDLTNSELAEITKKLEIIGSQLNN